METTVLEKAIDLKSKVMKLIQACSEVSNYLEIKIEDVQKVQESISEISDKILAFRKEKEAIEKALITVREKHQAEITAFESWKNSETQTIQRLKNDAKKALEDAQIIFAENQKRQSDLSAKFDEITSLKWNLEVKLAKIAEIGGK